MIRHCVVCGAEFGTPPSNNKRTCSPDCSAVWRSRQHKGRHNTWSAAAKQNAAAAAKKTGNLAHGTAAAMALPGGQRGPQNRSAKIWHLRSPGGEPVVAVNLLDWAREHAADCFDVEPTDENAERIAAGFRQLKRSMEGKLRRKNGAPYTVSTYKGWTLAAVENKKESTD